MPYNNVFAPENYLRYITRKVDELDVCLRNRSVYTELANGAYQLNALIPIIAGAEHTYLKVTDSQFGRGQDIKNVFFRDYNNLNLTRNYTFVDDENEIEALSSADIITNTGHLRPLNEGKLRHLKKNAVIPLMWETWEYNPEQLDLNYCKKKSILVMGTRETKEPVDMRGYNAMLVMKLLLKMGFSGENVVLIGGPDIFSYPMVRVLLECKVNVTYVANTRSADHSWSAFLSKRFSILNEADYLIFANHSFDCKLTDQFTFFREIAENNPRIKIGNISSDLKSEALDACGLNYFPNHFLGQGHMSFNMFELGITPVLHLFIAGLKVGLEMSKAMTELSDTGLAAKKVLETSPAMDFPGENSWLR